MSDPLSKKDLVFMEQSKTSHQLSISNELSHVFKNI